jgi:alpha-tubulin suppressor-like RCC1 family protein
VLKSRPLALIACLAACRDSSSVPTTGPTHFVLAAAGTIVRSSGFGGGSACLITLFTGAVHCWGYNGNGTFGNGSTENSDVPVPGGSGMTFYALSVGVVSACGIASSSRSLYCWGSYGDNQHLTPVLFNDDHKFKDLSGGVASGCALTVEGDAYCWGEGTDGELGDGLNAPSATPVQVVGGHTFASIGVGGGFACGLTTQRDAYCWGINDGGQLGSGSAEQKSSATPVLVTGQHHFTSLSVGADHVCALDPAGEAWCWGHNNDSQLGNGSDFHPDFNPHPTPERVSGNIDFSVISAGGGSSCGVSSDGAAYCWGQNFYGQLGNGSTNHGYGNYIPVAVAGGLTFVSIQAGGPSSCGITSNADVYCWGDNRVGELGYGEAPSSLVPVKVSFTP